MSKKIDAASVSVEFWHEIFRADLNMINADTKWTVTGTNHTVASPNSGTFKSTATIRNAKVAETKNLTFNLNEGDRIEVCQTITYTPKTVGGKDQGSSKACAIIVRDKGSEETLPSACPLPNSVNSIDIGNSQAASAVRNMTLDGVWQETTETNHTAIVWAKPGDSVQFKHTYCYGAQNVRGSVNSPGSSRTILPSAANAATISASTMPATSGANYLFGKTLTGTDSQTFNLTKGEARPSQISKADEVGDYYFTFYSPSQNSGDTYKCYAGSMGFPVFNSNGYQIPNFTSGTKPSDCRAVAASDVGKIIEQKLDWTDVKSWVNTYSTQGGGSCSCDNSSANNTVSTTSVNYGETGAGKVGYHIRRCDASGNCGCCGEYCTPCKVQYKLVDYWYYPISTTSNTGATKTTQVKIPFNYKTRPKTTVDNTGGVVFGGEDTNVNVTVDIVPRNDNPNVPGDYATISKPSTYEVVAFTVPSSYHSMPSKLYGNDSASGTSSTRACSYYGISGGKCQSIRREEDIFLNDEGNLKGATETLLSLSTNIPDLEVGWKYCVAVGVFPSNSHNTVSRPPTNDAALEADNGNTWNYSKASCVTIAKKPSVDMYNSGAITAGGITTSISKKNINYDLPGNNNPCSFTSATSVSGGNCSVSDNYKARRVFGSWSEYETVAKGSIDRFGSGAAYGYERNNGGTYSTPGGYNSVDYNDEPKACTYGTQTLSNDKCSDKTLGLSKINPLDITLSRVISRYTATSLAATQSSGNLDLSGVCIAGGDGKYHPSLDGVNIANSASFSCLENGAKYIKVKGHATLSAGKDLCLNPGNPNNNNTTVIDASGTLTISSNIIYGTSSGNKCNASTYDNIAEIPQMLIFADKIDVASSATRVDAWLISGSGSGVVNTCSDVTFYTGLSADICSRQLVINGPVFAGSLSLNRTYGAGTGHASIQAAEIFNLRSDAYYWAYNQAQRFSQSVTVYSRELAPRY